MNLRTITTLLVLALFLSFSVESVEARGIKGAGQKSSSDNGKSDKDSSKGKSKEKPFAKLIKDKVKIEGLFTFYHDTVDNSVLMAINPEHFGPIYLFGSARSSGDGTFYDAGYPSRTFPLYFKRVGKKILVMEKNLRVRADTSSTMFKAVAAGISDHLFTSLVIKSKPEDSTEAVLVDPSAMFITDYNNTGYYLGKAKKGFSFDSKNSYYKQLKSFEQNSEIDVMLHYKSSKPNSGVTLQSGRSFYHQYHYSISAIPETDYVPRLSDDRIGYFETMYLDYTELDHQSPYVRYVNRWDLKKKNPDARISEPITPIVYWIENTVPPEYRDALAEGIEFWNPAFEKIGFRNAVVAKQMPDTASWDPLDTRYSVIRWIYSPRIYAVGPSRANPFTGEIYDADIGVSSDFVRAMFINMDEYIGPISFDGRLMKEEEFNPFEQESDRICTFATGLAEHAGFGLSYLYSNIGDMADKDSLTKEYVHAYLVELIAHEVGHTLGFRHNYKASTIYSLDQINDREFTTKHGTMGTVMEYAPANIAGKGQTQGEFYSSTPGPYDYWIVEYGYSDFGAENPEDETEQLEQIASRSAEKGLAYCTDYDLYNAYAVDPYANTWDLGNDPLAYSEHQVRLIQDLWSNTLSKFEKPGVSYEKIRRVFTRGMRYYRYSALYAARYIGGLIHNKNYVGAEGGTIPFTPVSAAEQKRAMNFLRDKIFAADAFNVSSDMLNKLQHTRKQDFRTSLYGSPIAYPWHQYIMSIQNTALNILYNPHTLGRLVNNLDRYKKGEERYTMHDMFRDTRRAIWGEITGPSNVNSHRRQLQMSHLTRIVRIYLSGSFMYPSDARTLAANDLDVLENAVKKAVNSAALNDMSKAHFKEVLRQIKAAKNSEKEYSKF
ncbi:MAG: zinc-dependent metalloprotease [candidate division Zixibacteria bacterium]|nr:zinc-dependent metalloprotease [candidate division Zixibacteria bacterium]